MNICGVVVLSPHRDDAVFSVAHLMRSCCEAGVPLAVLNFFTVSEYAPWQRSPEGVSRKAAVVAARTYEDRHALFCVHDKIRSVSCGLLDAPLRMSLPVPQVMQLTPVDVRSEDVKTLGRELRRISRNCLVLSPLGLGGHIDHLTTRQAAMTYVHHSKLLFYEDLPYASWTPPDIVREHLRQVSRIELKRHKPKWRSSRLQKQSWTSQYGSQIRREDAKLIAGYWTEGVWGPARALAHLP